MIPKECKRLAEVDFPIAVVSRFAVAENNVRHSHPKILHLWWARRPLAACRAVLLGLLLPDPCDDLCPTEFKTRARDILPRVQGNPVKTDIDLRNELLRFIGDFSSWDSSAKPAFVEAAISFDSDVYLLLPKRAQELKSGVQAVEVVPEATEASPAADPGAGPLFTTTKPETGVAPSTRDRTLTIRGEVPTEVWNRLGRTLIPSLKPGTNSS